MAMHAASVRRSVKVVEDFFLRRRQRCVKLLENNQVLGHRCLMRGHVFMHFFGPLR